MANISRIKKGSEYYDIHDSRLDDNIFVSANYGKNLIINNDGDLDVSDSSNVITEIRMNGISKGTHGSIDLGTVVTSHQSLTDLGITLTAAEINNRQEQLISTQNIKTVNGESILGSGNISIAVDNHPSWGNIIGNIAAQTDLQNAFDLTIQTTMIGEPNGVAELDSSGKIIASQLPSYVDDIEEYQSAARFPSTGESGKIYVAIDTSTTYRWSGSQYILVGDGSLTLGETETTAYRGDRGKAAYNHSLVISGNPHHVTKADLSLDQVENKSSAMIRNEITVNNIPNLSASKITSGTLSTDRIPNLDASKITSGELPDNRIASASRWDQKPDTLADFGLTVTVNELNQLDGVDVTVSEFNCLQDITENIQLQLNNKMEYDATLLKQSNVINNLTSDSTIYPLSAKQGKELNISKVNISDVKDNLTSLDIDKPLSAKQGKLLKDITDELRDNVDENYVQLWKSPNGWTNAGYTTSGILTMSEDWTQFKEIMFIFSHAGYRIPISQSIPVQFLKEFYLDTGYSDYGVMVAGYDNQYSYLRPVTTTTFYFTYGNAAYLYAIYGRRY